MSLHSSLKIDRASVTQRTVQTRIERIKELMKKGLWKEESGVIGLPKTRIIRIKAKKKVKAEDAAAPAGAGGANPAKGGADAAKTTAAKPAAGAVPIPRALASSTAMYLRAISGDMYRFAPIRAQKPFTALANAAARSPPVSSA